MVNGPLPGRACERAVDGSARGWACRRGVSRFNDGIANSAFDGNCPQILGNHISSICIKFYAYFIQLWAKTSLTRERRLQSRLLACTRMR
jgi:hypothetical protein